MESVHQLQQSANESIRAAHITEVHMVPMNVIVRPIMPTLDDLKVQSLMQTIQVCFLKEMSGNFQKPGARLPLLFAGP